MNDHVHPALQAAFGWFAPPSHDIKRESVGCGLEEVTTPVCTTCGWKGRPVSASSDYQSTELANQEYQHRMAGCSVEQLRKGGVL